MEHRDLAASKVSRTCRAVLQTLWLRTLLLVAGSVGAFDHAHAQFPESNDPRHVVIYKVNGKCGDTIQLMRHPTSMRSTWLSRTRCPVNLGFGDVFKPANNKLLILQDQHVFLLMGYHRDRMLDIQAEEQYIISPYGAYRVKLKEETLLEGKWKTWTFLIKPDAGNGSTIVLRLNAVLGIVGIQHLDRNRVSVGQMELVQVDGLPLAQFVQQSNF
jgi:hypothetical protein